MLKKRMTRKEFLKTGFAGILILLAAPVFKLFSGTKTAQSREARYYKNLAG